MSCPAEEHIVAFVQHELATADRAAVECHLDVCTHCASVVADLVRVFPGELESFSRQSRVSHHSDPTATLEEDHEATDAWCGRNVGRYEVRRLIGAGAMGAVYVAYDPELDREIALKLLRSGVTEDAARQQRRLQREAQVLARLSHPNVIVVHDVGVEGEMVFIAMEYVRGVTLGRWLRQRPRSWSEIREVFRAAGRGLAAAHAAGIIHRDFKPDNVLIGWDDRVRVTDFGLARVQAGGDALLSLTTLTAKGRRELVGTPAYMAPEQFECREADAATDQFSFCVALYEAIYDRRPFRGDSLESLAHSVSRGLVNVPPRKRGIPRRVRTALARGLRPQRNDRFPSMDVLLGVLAGNPSLVGTAAAVAVGVTASALIVMPSLWREAPVQACDAAVTAPQWSEEARAKVRNVYGRSARPYAQRAFAQLDDAFGEYVEAWTDARKQTCDLAERPEASDDLEVARVRCLEGARFRFDSLAAALAVADPEIVEHTAKIIDRLPRIETCWDRPESVVEPVPNDPELAARVARLRLRLTQSYALELGGRHQEASVLISAIVEDSEALNYKPLMAEAFLAQGQNAVSMDDAALAKRALQRAVVESTGAQYRQITAWAWLHLIHVHAEMFDDPEEAERVATFARAEVEGLGGDAEIEAGIWMSLGNVYARASEVASARSAYERARALYEQLDRPLRVLDVDVNLAGMELVSENYEAAVARHREVLRRHEGTFAPTHPSVYEVRLNLGTSLRLAGHLEEAEALLRSVKEDCEAMLGSVHQQTLRTLKGYVDVLRDLGRHEQAVAQARALSAGARKRAVKGLEHFVASCDLELLRTLVSAGEMDEALQLADDLGSRLFAAHGRPSAEAVDFFTLQGTALMKKGRPKAALAPFSAALEDILGLDGAHARHTALSWGRLGEAQWQAGLSEQGAQALQRAVELGQPLAELEQDVAKWRALLAAAP